MNIQLNVMFAKFLQQYYHSIYIIWPSMYLYPGLVKSEAFEGIYLPILFLLIYGTKKIIF
jgi:hypothetical protein